VDFEDFLKELAPLLSVERKELTEDFALDPNTNWDSLTIISMMALMDDHFEVEISGEQLRRCSSIGDVLKLIEQSKAL
jgi:acyl carrier protein